MREAIDHEQVQLDLDDARLRLERLRRAIQKRDEAEALVRSLTQQLRTAKRRAREAGWELSSSIHAERRQPCR